MGDEPSSSEKQTVPTDMESAHGVIARLEALIATLHALIKELRESLTAKDEEVKELRRALYGPKSERQPRSKSAKRKKRPLTDEEKAKRREATRRKRAAIRNKRAEELAEQQVAHEAPSVCPKCSGEGPFTPLSPEISHEIEYMEEHLRRLVHVLGKKLCPCGHIFSAPAPERVAEGGVYGPNLHAYAVVSKCADALPLYRIAKRLARAGVHVARSSLTDMFHRTAELLQPIHRRLVELVAASDYVNADETSQPVMAKDHCRRGFIWTFIANSIVAYVFTRGRSGETPARILGNTTGYLQVDGYTGYNTVCVPEGRERIGCLAHSRRYFHKARDQCPDECEVAFQFIRKLYEVEFIAAERGLIGTDAHRILRQDRSQPILDEFHEWLETHKDTHDPKGPMGRAINYTLNQWRRLIRFVNDSKLRLDNNISEGALRIIALGRDDFCWVGHDVAGENLAVLQTIVATCIANKVNPQHYIADVIMRTQTHPAAAIDQLLPMNWTPPESVTRDEQ